MDARSTDAFTVTNGVSTTVKKTILASGSSKNCAFNLENSDQIEYSDYRCDTVIKDAQSSTATLSNLIIEDISMSDVNVSNRGIEVMTNVSSQFVLRDIMITDSFINGIVSNLNPFGSVFYVVADRGAIGGDWSSIICSMFYTFFSLFSISLIAIFHKRVLSCGDRSMLSIFYGFQRISLMFFFISRLHFSFAFPTSTPTDAPTIVDYLYVSSDGSDENMTSTCEDIGNPCKTWEYSISQLTDSGAKALIIGEDTTLTITNGIVNGSYKIFGQDVETTILRMDTPESEIMFDVDALRIGNLTLESANENNTEFVALNGGTLEIDNIEIVGFDSYVPVGTPTFIEAVTSPCTSIIARNWLFKTAFGAFYVFNIDNTDYLLIENFELIENGNEFIYLLDTSNVDEIHILDINLAHTTSSAPLINVVTGTSITIDNITMENVNGTAIMYIQHIDYIDLTNAVFDKGDSLSSSVVTTLNCHTAKFDNIRMESVYSSTMLFNVECNEAMTFHNISVLGDYIGISGIYVEPSDSTNASLISVQNVVFDDVSINVLSGIYISLWEIIDLLILRDISFSDMNTGSSRSSYILYVGEPEIETAIIDNIVFKNVYANVFVFYFQGASELGAGTTGFIIGNDNLSTISNISFDKTDVQTSTFSLKFLNELDISHVSCLNCTGNSFATMNFDSVFNTRISNIDCIDCYAGTYVLQTTLCHNIIYEYFNIYPRSDFENKVAIVNFANTDGIAQENFIDDTGYALSLLNGIIDGGKPFIAGIYLDLVFMQQMNVGEYNVIFENVIFRNTERGTWGGDSSSLIYVDGTNTSLLIRNCTFENNLNWASVIKCNSGSECNVLIENSLFINNVGTYSSSTSINGFYLETGANGVITIQDSDLVADYDLYGWDVINDSFIYDVDSSIVLIDVEYKVALDRLDVIINGDFILDSSNRYLLSSDLGDFAADILTATLNHPNDTTVTFNSNHITILSYSNSSIEFKLHHYYFGIGIAAIDAYTLAQWNALLLNISTNYATIDILVTDSVTVGENGYTSTVSDAPTTSPTSPTLIPSTVPSGMPSSTPTSMPTFNPSTDPTNRPTEIPTTAPTNDPSVSPTGLPSGTPTTVPTNDPSISPTGLPSGTPTTVPTFSVVDEYQMIDPNDINFVVYESSASVLNDTQFNPGYRNVLHFYVEVELDTQEKLNLFTSWIDGSIDIEYSIEWNVYNGSRDNMNIDSLIDTIKFEDAYFMINESKFIIDSYYILYPSSVLTNGYEYSSSICNAYSTDIFMSNNMYYFENTITFTWNYDNSSSPTATAKKSLLLQATQPPSNGDCFVTSTDDAAIELLSIFNFSCVNWESNSAGELYYNFLHQDGSYFLKSSYDSIPYATTRLSENIDTMTAVIVNSLSGAVSCFDINNITVNSLEIGNISVLTETCDDTISEDDDDDAVITVGVCYEILIEILNDTTGDSDSNDDDDNGALTGSAQEGLIETFLNSAGNITSYQDAIQLLSILATLTDPIAEPYAYMYRDELIESVLDFVEAAVNFLGGLVSDEDNEIVVGTDVAQSVVGM